MLIRNYPLKGELYLNGKTMYTREQIKEAVESKGHKFFEESDWNVNIIGIRNSETANKVTNKFARVEHSSQATKTQQFSPILSCLITHDHRIRLGDQEFWDWEDDN